MKTPPPIRDGISASSVQLPRGPWPTVLAFLEARFAEISPAAWRSRIERGLVIDGSGGRIAADTPYAEGSDIHYYRELDAEPTIPFEADIIFEDAELLVADKPHFLPVMPAGRYLQQTLLVRLKKQTGLEQLAPLHRIDRGTAGVVVFSKNPQTRGLYQSLFARREMEKTYEALAPCLPGLAFPLTRRSRLVEGEPFFRMREAEGAANSETRIALLQERGALSLYRLQPVTGKKHQLRVHLAALGAPIVNDPFYPQLREQADDDFTQPLKLLARALAFVDPLSGAQRAFRSSREL